MLYTDGVVEDRTTDVDAGVARLCALVASQDPAKGDSTLCDRLLDELLTAPRTTTPRCSPCGSPTPGATTRRLDGHTG